MTGAERGVAPAGFDVTVDPSRVCRLILVVCVAGALALLFLDYGVNYSRWSESGSIRRLFNMTREDALASWFAVTVTTFTAVTAWLGFALARRRDLPRSRVAGWLVLALFLSWMTIDDGAAIHERVGSAVDETRVAEAQSAGPLAAFPSYTWQVIFLPLFAALGAFTLWFLWRELAGRRGRAEVALAIGLFALAVVLDFFEGLDPAHSWNVYVSVASREDVASFTASQFGRLPYDALIHFSKTVEEAVEIVAMALLWVVLLGLVARQADGARIAVRGT